MCTCGNVDTRTRVDENEQMDFFARFIPDLPEGEEQDERLGAPPGEEPEEDGSPDREGREGTGRMTVGAPEASMG